MASSKPPVFGPLPPHRLYRDFLAAGDHSSLLEWALASETLLEASAVGSGRVDPSRRLSRSLPMTPGARLRADSPLSHKLKPWREMLIGRVRQAMPGLFSAAGTKPFDVSHVELELVVYHDGAHFKPHRDAITIGEAAETDRLLTGIYYFFAEPKGFSGGGLRLYRFGADAPDPGNFLEIEPEQNSFLVFPSWVTHEVTEVSCPGGAYRDGRFAINCWLHRRREPAS